MLHQTPDETDDEWAIEHLYPLKTNYWFDHSEQTY